MFDWKSTNRKILIISIRILIISSIRLSVDLPRQFSIIGILIDIIRIFFVYFQPNRIFFSIKIRTSRGLKRGPLLNLNKFLRFLSFSRESLCVSNNKFTKILICGTENLWNQGTVELRIPETQYLSPMYPGFMKARTTETKDPWNEGTVKPKIYSASYVFYAGTFFSFCANVIHSVVCEKSLAT